jgi:hypothetical protein
MRRDSPLRDESDHAIRAAMRETLPRVRPGFRLVGGSSAASPLALVRGMSWPDDGLDAWSVRIAEAPVLAGIARIQ